MDHGELEIHSIPPVLTQTAICKNNHNVHVQFIPLSRKIGTALYSIYLKFSHYINRMRYLATEIVLVELKFCFSKN